jgi:FkbM family methyltransferase
LICGLLYELALKLRVAATHIDGLHFILANRGSAGMNLPSIKTKLVNTNIARLALHARDLIGLIRIAYCCPESVGMLANDQLATYLVTRMCLPRKGFIDAGAHIGSVMAAVIRHDPSIKLYAIEPMPTKIRHLRQRFPTVELHECALGEVDGEVPFFVNTKESGYSSLSRPANVEGTETITVQLKKLDTLISSDDIDVIKIDVEGAELGVFRGGDTLIKRSRPTIMFESAPPNDVESECQKESMWRWLEERDFEIVVPNRVAHNGSGLSLEGFIEAHLYPRRTTNYFAIPKERRIEIRDRARSVLQIAAD